MSKTIKYAKNAAILLGLGNSVLNIISQLKAMEKAPDLKFSWSQFFAAAGKGAAVGGGVGLSFGAIVDYLNNKEKKLKTDGLIKGLVSRIRLDKSDPEFQKLSGKTNLIIDDLKKEFRKELFNDPIRSGSTEAGTALRDDFDIDVAIPFRADSFKSTAEMYHSVYDYLESNMTRLGVMKVRKQKKSIGLFVKFNSGEYKIDVVPYKITRKNRNKTSGYLYINNDNFFNNDSSYTKTDIHALNNIPLTKMQQDIFVVLKDWKRRNEVPLGSHLLKLLILEAYKYRQGQIPSGVTKKIIMVLEYIADNLESTVIRSIENSNNVLTDKLSSESKTAIVNACRSAVEDYKYQPNSVVDTFGI